MNGLLRTVGERMAMEASRPPGQARQISVQGHNRLRTCTTQPQNYWYTSATWWAHEPGV
jgi:hypothetical protein